MARPRSPLWTRICAKIDHPLAANIPHLAHEDPEEWPEPFKTLPWTWTGATIHGNLPVIAEKGRTQMVSRLIYSRLIEPLGPRQRLLTGPNPLDLNPILHRPILLEQETLPPPPPDETQEPAFAAEFDLDEVADRLDDLNPKTVDELHRLWPDMLSEYYPTQIFDALTQANLATRMGLKSPLELTQ